MNMRIGKVCNADESNRTVRVIFEEEGFTSGWLKVLKNPPTIFPNGGAADETDEKKEHKHKLSIHPWMPRIGEIVLCIYDDSFNADGYVIGGM